MLTRLILVSSTLCLACFGDVFDLNFNALPSSQGWSYVGTVAEGTAVQASSQGLKMDSMTGTASSTGYYEMLGPVGPGPIEIDFTMKVLDSEGTFGWGPEVSTGTLAYTMQFSKNSITSYASFGTLAFDTTSFHDYRFVVQPGIGMSLFIDGSATPALTGGNLSSSAPSGVRFGDFTSAGNADVILATPEPDSIWLLGLVVALAVGVPAYRRKKQASFGA